jgi:hypothetical protein
LGGIIALKFHGFGTVDVNDFNYNTSHCITAS